MRLTIGSSPWILVGWRCNQMSKMIPTSPRFKQIHPRIERWSSATASRSHRRGILLENSWWIFLSRLSRVCSFSDFKINYYNHHIIKLKTWLTIKYTMPIMPSIITWTGWETQFASREASIQHICSWMFSSTSYCQSCMHTDYKIFLRSRLRNQHLILLYHSINYIYNTYLHASSTRQS